MKGEFIGEGYAMNSWCFACKRYAQISKIYKKIKTKTPSCIFYMFIVFCCSGGSKLSAGALSDCWFLQLETYTHTFNGPFSGLPR